MVGQIPYFPGSQPPFFEQKDPLDPSMPKGNLAYQPSSYQKKEGCHPKSQNTYLSEHKFRIIKNGLTTGKTSKTIAQKTDFCLQRDLNQISEDTRFLSLNSKEDTAEYETNLKRLYDSIHQAHRQS